MSNDPMTNPASSTTNQASSGPSPGPIGPDGDKGSIGPEKPQFLQGKLTYIGLVLATIGSVAKLFGISLPTDEANAFLKILSENWDTFATLIGLLTAAWGRIRINFRKA